MPPLNPSANDNVVTLLTTSQAFVQYSLFVAMMALGAAAVFFLVSREKLPVQYRSINTTSALICGIAAVAYYYLLNHYSPGKPFPTDFRYVDWTVTTPLLLLKYPEMLRLKSHSFAWKLVFADLFMIVTGFIGELSGYTLNGQWHGFTANAISSHLAWGFVSTIGYAIILYLLLVEAKNLAQDQPLPIKHGLKAMNIYIWSLWGVYPIIYILEAVSASHSALNLDWANSVASIADVINKAGFGLTAYFAVRALSGDNQESAARLSENANASTRADTQVR
jgi:sensory rhodopsin